MQEDFKQIFSELPEVRVPADLTDRILSEINRRQRKMVFIRSSFFVFASLAFGVLLFLATASTRVAFMESGFVKYFSLLFSDASSVIGSSGSFIYVLVQTLPAFRIAITISVLVLFLLTIKWSLDNLRKIGLLNNLK